MITTIQVDTKLKNNLDKLKVHHRETYNELITRLIENCSLDNASRESLIATIEVLSDPEMMQGISRGLGDIELEKTKPFEQVKKELGINV